AVGVPSSPGDAAPASGAVRVLVVPWAMRPPFLRASIWPDRAPTAALRALAGCGRTRSGRSVGAEYVRRRRQGSTGLFQHWARRAYSARTRGTDGTGGTGNTRTAGAGPPSRRGAGRGEPGQRSGVCAHRSGARATGPGAAYRGPVCLGGAVVAAELGSGFLGVGQETVGRALRDLGVGQLAGGILVPVLVGDERTPGETADQTVDVQPVGFLGVADGVEGLLAVTAVVGDVGVVLPHEKFLDTQDPVLAAVVRAVAGL